MIGQHIRAIIFDLDGVLMLSTDCHRAAFDEVFRGLGIDDFDYTPYAGWRTLEVIADVLTRRGQSASAETIAAAAAEKSARARELLYASQPLAPGCEALLAKLAADYHLALASSGSRSSVDSFLQLTGSRSLFRSVLSGGDVTKAKPDPEIYKLSAQRLGLKPSECLVVEDALAGVKAARAAGAEVVGLAGTYSADMLREAGACETISTLVDLEDLLSSADAQPIDSTSWTAVIPAAGRGSRLGFHRPKILYPVAGRPILDWLLDCLEPNCSRLVFVLSPEGADDVSAELNGRIPGRFEVVIQETPTGMGDAVALGLARVRTRNVAIVWGDQVALRPASVESCMRLHAGPLEPDATCPTVMRPDPYIHFDRDAEGSLSGLRQAREGDTMPATGESDTGFFSFQAEPLRRWLDRLRQQGVATGSATREFNFLPVIPMAAAEGLVVTPRIMQLEETVGINSGPDAAGVEEYLRSAHGCRV